MIKITIPALKYFLKHGLEGVKGLPEKEVTALRIALALNFQSKEGFLAATKSTGIDATRLGALWDSETHLCDQMAGLETARAGGMGTKVWTTNGSCSKCKHLDGEAAPIDKPFSNNQMVAHGHDSCSCSTTYKKDRIEMKEKVFTKGEIAEMSKEEYAANRTAILEQYASGLIK